MKTAGFLALFVIALTAPAAAHVVITDGTIGVTMHIDPDDAPVTGSPSRFSFWFKDTSGRLDPAQCRGTFTVANADNFLFSSQALFARTDTGLISVHEVTFREPGVYTVRLNGAPRGAQTFSPFLIEFKVRVTAGGTNSWWGDHWIWLAVGGLAVAVFLWWGLRPGLPQKKKS